jgi:hypothetical protein
MFSDPGMKLQYILRYMSLKLNFFNAHISLCFLSINVYNQFKTVDTTQRYNHHKLYLNPTALSEDHNSQKILTAYNA